MRDKIFKLSNYLKMLLKGKGSISYVMALPEKARVLDVGCGNDSPRVYKTLRPDIYYVGLDVGDYRQKADPEAFADEYIISPPELFAETIAGLPDQFDAIISAHNIEHCNEPQKTLAAMMKALKRGGSLYMSFPCEKSVHFPRRKGTSLNFYDDPTHERLPVLNEIVGALREAGCEITFLARRYRPGLLAFLGLLIEPYCFFTKKNIPGFTWALYGFETVIWASKR